MAAYLVEAGLLLMIAPWTASWQRNYFGAMLPWLGAWMANEFVRGGISGVGVLTLVAGLRDLNAVIFSRQAEPPRPAAPTSGVV